MRLCAPCGQQLVPVHLARHVILPAMPPPVHIVGVSLDLGGNRRGVDMGPSAFRIAGLGERLTALGITVADEGDLVAPIPEVKSFGDPRKKYIREITRVCERLYKTSLGILEKGGLPLVLGGDHSLAAGSVAATSEFVRRDHKPLGLLWVDAHGDMNTPTSSASGNVHGMPLASLLGPEPAELSRIGGFSPKVTPDRTVLLGIRNLDDREKELMRESGVHVFTMKDIDRAGIAAIVEQALAIAGSGTGGIHVSFDLDVCDPTIAPGVGTPVKGGLDYREAHMVMEMVADSGLLRALDLVEVNPILDDRNTTAILAAELASSALGQKII
jgi:arginase